MNDVVIPDVAEPITAYRWWRCNPLLTSISFQIVWEREMVAKPCHETLPFYNWDTARPNPCNGPVCTDSSNPIALGCGIYALNSFSGAALYPDVQLGVLGKVLLAGKVFLCEKGYRAEKAKIVGLYSPAAFKPFLRYFEGIRFPRIVDSIDHLAQLYDVPLISELSDDEHKDMLATAEKSYVTRLLIGHYDYDIFSRLSQMLNWQQAFPHSPRYYL